jgi:hypothetical protein
MKHFLVNLTSTLGLVVCTASAQDYIETFDGGVNAGGWTYGNTIEGIDASGGNPGAFLHNSLIDTFAPQLSTSNSSNPFLGNYRALGVQSLGVDLKTFSTNFPFLREATLMLSNGGCTVYTLGTELVPQVAEGWKSFDYQVDSASTAMPSGWLPFGGCTDPDTAWNTVMTNVTEVRFFYGDPTFFFIFDQWNVGADNPRISTAPPTSPGTPFCFGDGSGSVCPCSNLGAAGEGCANSSGQGAVVGASGGASVANDNISFTARQLPIGKPALLFVGDAMMNGGAGSLFGDGLLCAGGNIQRFYVQFADAGGQANWGPGLATVGGWVAGDRRWFQVWYRDNTGPCMNGFNTSNGVEVLFTN